LCYFLRLGVCDSALAAADFCALAADDDRKVALAADAAARPVWSRLPVCASALAAADFCAFVAADDRSVLLAAEAAARPV
jgi:hypothetical protein